MYDLDQLGQISGAFDLVPAALRVLETWLPAAVLKLNDGGYQASDGKMVPPMSYGRVPTDVISQVADQVPAVMASSPGITGKPIQQGETGWAAWYTLNVTVVDRGDDWETTADRAQVWAALVRQVILANQTLMGVGGKVVWQTENYGPIPSDSGRTYAGCTVGFSVLMPALDLGDFGPLTPNPVIPDPATGVPNPLSDTPVVVEFLREDANAPVP